MPLKKNITFVEFTFMFPNISLCYLGHVFLGDLLI